VIRDGIPMWRKMAVELQSGCNRDCVFCPRHHNRSGVRKDDKGKQTIQRMPTEKAKDIILQVEALGYQGKISFHRLSESFLDPRYIEMAEFAVEHGLRVFDNTNGDILKKRPELIPRLDGLVEFIKIGLYDYSTWKEKKAEMEFWRAQFEKTRIEFSCPLEIPEIRQGARLQTEHSKRVAKRRQEKILDLDCTGPLRAPRPLRRRDRPLLPGRRVHVQPGQRLRDPDRGALVVREAREDRTGPAEAGQPPPVPPLQQVLPRPGQADALGRLQAARLDHRLQDGLRHARSRGAAARPPRGEPRRPSRPHAGEDGEVGGVGESRALAVPQRVTPPELREPARR
jgi:hypothetical protein